MLARVIEFTPDQLRVIEAFIEATDQPVVPVPMMWTGDGELVVHAGLADPEDMPAPWPEPTEAESAAIRKRLAERLAKRLAKLGTHIEDGADMKPDDDPRPDPPPGGQPYPDGQLPSLNIRSEWSDPPPAREWLVDGWLPAHRIAMLAGRGAAGKSQITLQLATAITFNLPAGATRTWFAGGPAIQGGPAPVVFATWEDDSTEILRRLLGNPGLSRGAPEFDETAGGRFHFADLAGTGPLWASDTHRSFGELTPVGESLRAVCQSLGARLLIVDALSSAFAGNENERAAVRAFLSSWDRWARDTRCTVLLIAHPPKSDGPDSHYSGSTDWRAGVRSLLTLSRPRGASDRAKLECDKLNSAQTPSPVALGSPRWWETIEVDPELIDDAVNLKLRETVLSAIRKHGPMNRTAIRAAVQKGKAAVDDILARMELDKTLAMEQDGNSKIYSIQTTPEDGLIDAGIPF